MPPHQILVVDDEDSIRHVLQSILEMKGCEVRAAASAEEAIEMLRPWEPEVALLDIIMPGKNGIQLLGEIKQLSRDTEVLMMTSNASADTALKAMRLGAYDYLKKPFDLAEVWATVQRAIGRRNLNLKNRAMLNKREERNRQLSAEVSLGEEESGPDLEVFSEALDDFLGLVTRELDVERASLMMLDPQTGELRIAASRGLSDVDVETVSVPIGEGIAGRVAETGEPFLVQDVATDRRVTGDARPGLSDSFISAPIVLSVAIKTDHEVLGVINVTNRRNGQPFGAEEVSYLAGVASQLAATLEGAKRAERLRRAYESLKAAQDRLVRTERIKAIGQMAAGVAHDFNNVLSVILARSQFILRALDPDAPRSERIKEHVDTIIKTSLQGSEAIKRIQDYTRIRKDVPAVPVDLNAIVRDAVEIARPKWKEQCEAEGRHIEVRLDLQEVPCVSGNQYELAQVFGNLIFNAVEAMPEGGCLSFRSFSSDEDVVLEVQDTGTGMDEETQKHLFEPFFTTKETGQGLGTSIIYGIVTRHRGIITVHSKVGEGTTFRVTLPKSDAVARDAGAESVRPEQPFRAAAVLLVDDDEMVRDTFTEALVSNGHEVTAVASADDALSAMERREFDLVITDLSLEGKTGLELATEIKQRRADLPMVLCSGWAVQQQGREVSEAGINHVLVKPCMIEDLLSTVQAAMSTPVRN